MTERISAAAYKATVKKSRAKRDNPEDRLQYAVVAKLHQVLPDYSIFTHVPNQGKFPVQYRVKLKRMGLLAGFPDLLIAYGGKTYYIELKSEDGTLSPAQKDVHEKMVHLNIPIVVCRSVEDVLCALREWGIPLKGVHS